MIYQFEMKSQKVYYEGCAFSLLDVHVNGRIDRFDMVILTMEKKLSC
jgi:hypothetical protein